MTGIIPGQDTNADEAMNAYGANFNDTAQMIFNADYIGFDSKLHNAGAPNLKNVFYSTFQTDDASTNTGFKHNSTGDYYQLNLTDEASGDTTHDPDGMTNPENAFDDDDSTFADKQFTDTNPSVTNLGKTFSSKDVESVYFKVNGKISEGGIINSSAKVQSFNGSSWSDVAGTTVILASDVDSQQYFNINETGIEGLRVVVTVQSDSGSSDNLHKIYSFEYGDATTVGTLIFKDTASESVTNAIPAINTSIDATSSQQISISANGGSNYTDVDNTEIARPTPGTELWRRIVITRSDLSKIDKVTEQAVKFNYY